MIGVNIGGSDDGDSKLGPLKIDYIALYETVFKSAGAFFIILLITWAFILIDLLARTASDYLTPTLASAALKAKISTSLAGVTLLAFANGAPDVFAALSGFAGSTNSGISIGELLGGAAFISTVVVSAIAITCPCHVSSTCFVRDLVFLIIAVSALLIVGLWGSITIGIALSLFAVYATYIGVVLLTPKLEKYLMTKAGKDSNSGSQETTINERLQTAFWLPPSAESVIKQENNQSSMTAEQRISTAANVTATAQTVTPSHPQTKRSDPGTDQTPSQTQAQTQAQKMMSFSAVMASPLAGSEYKFLILDEGDLESGHDMAVKKSELKGHQKETSIVNKLKKVIHSSSNMGQGNNNSNDEYDGMDTEVNLSGSLMSQTFPATLIEDYIPVPVGLQRTTAVMSESASSNSDIDMMNNTAGNDITAPLSDVSGVVIDGTEALSSESVCMTPNRDFDDNRKKKEKEKEEETKIVDEYMDEDEKCTNLAYRFEIGPNSPLVSALLSDSNMSSSKRDGDDDDEDDREEMDTEGCDSASNSSAVATIRYHIIGKHTARIGNRFQRYLRQLVRRRRHIKPPDGTAGEEGGDWLLASCPCLQRFFSILTYPVVLLRDLTIPTVDPVLWYKPYAILQPFCAPIFLLVLSGHTHSTLDSVSVLFWLVLVGICPAMWVFLFTHYSRPPEAPLFVGCWLLLSFVVCVAWIYLFAAELVSVLSALGTILGVPTDYMGLTVLAWGNSSADLFADLSVAKKGFGQMAIGGCFGGPIFNILIGLGLSLTYISIRSYPQPYNLTLDSSALLSIVSLYVSLISSLCVVVFCKFQLSPRLGYFLIVLYAIYSIAQTALVLHSQ